MQRDQPDIVLLHINEYPVEAAGEVFDTLAALRDEGKLPASAGAAIVPSGSVENDYNVFTPAHEVKDSFGALEKSPLPNTVMAEIAAVLASR